MNYSSPGLGTTPQLSCELLRVRAGIAMQHIPYNSGPQATQALLTNLVQLFCSAMPLVQPHIDAGTLKPLAVTSATRWRGLPDVPTMQEAGFDDFVTDTMVMLAGPARLPTEITAKVSQRDASDPDPAGGSPGPCNGAGSMSSPSPPPRLPPASPRRSRCGGTS